MRVWKSIERCYGLAISAKVGSLLSSEHHANKQPMSDYAAMALLSRGVPLNRSPEMPIPFIT
jgi:hypothetical protein